MFRHLHQKFATLYVALFLTVLALIFTTVFLVTTRNVEHVVRNELVESGTIFESMSATQTSRMEEEAGVLARDFGFRAAVATRDAGTVRSALDNLAARTRTDLAFMVNLDGSVMGREAKADRLLPASALSAIQNADSTVSGVMVIGGVAYETVAIPILTPTPSGWVVFADAIGPEAMHNLTKLSALPLEASVSVGASGETSVKDKAAADLRALVEASVSSHRIEPQKLAGPNGGALVFVRRLPSLGDGPPLALVLRCPLAAALQPFHALVTTIVLIGAVGLLLIVVGSWLLARTLTRPISALDEAVLSLKRGETARVEAKGNDELGRLGLSFNAMADEIVERQDGLTRALNVAEAANRAKSIFLANMNHEVRTPLNGVLGVAGMMASTPLDAGQRKMIGIIEASGVALQRILNDVLDMVDIGSDDLTLVDQPFDLGLFLAPLIETASVNALAKGLDFRLSTEPTAGRWVRGDEGRVRQILVNLLDNAVKFTPTGRVLFKVDHDTASGIYRFEVRDTGIGFEASRVEELFTAFNQADGSMTRRAGGTGLGLSLARDLARAMGGDITGEGEPGYGATFVFTLPLFPAEPGVHADIPEHAVLAAPHSGADMEERAPVRILLADDHAYNRMVIEMIVAGVDTDVVSVENGQEAVDAFKQQAFDVVLMDLQMPVMDGLTAIRLIRQHERETAAVPTPIVVISANVQAAHLRASAEAGADTHLAKPILAPTLLQALDDCLSARAAMPASIAV